MTSSLRFDGGTAVITGAASGIGSGLARQAATLGMRVVLADLDPAALDAFAATLDTDVLCVPTDVSRPEAVEALAEAAWSRFGGVDLLFNNAGVMATGFSWEITPERFEHSFAVNVHGVMNGIRSFVPRMLARNLPARVVNTASVGGFLPSPMMSPYSATKFAVVALTESLYGELKMLGSPIGVSLLAPGPVKSGIFNDPFGGSHDRPEVRGFVDTMRTMLDTYGLTPDAFAQRVFEGIREDRYWLIPQPEIIDGALQQRTESILAARNPVLPSY
ncbi:1-deoxy-11-beta-hydroxypentalenate dehydrogenase [Paraburkholderia caffeinitolerans]|uniref:1-deoxy-11-beta-hydroxypentalenate dehydrogenase n=1 Tax=Paraburkholderia caffeinitolerans TaxID=1723730 RepID=A0A6J5GJE0_9BURK|nr:MULTISPECIES: SDR family NAD(P)-dependent oxidoreductase [Paraburkholderia]CAB3802104.1 1-deoxy-11-beta-hydroxypentalenate dehydrogenase [Paraburkholderia caffeinitolerans]